MTISPSNLSAHIGRALLFVGNECAHWTPADFTQAAQSAKALGFDALVPKRFDGIYRWYADVAQLQAEQTAVEAEGIKFVPFGYLYGPAFGAAQIEQECALLAELQSVCHGVAVADMETQWNAHPDAAALFVQAMQKHPANVLIISTWADPVQQQWQDDIKTLDPIVSAWWPQQYDTWLAAQTSQFTALGAAPVQPTIDIRNDVGPNDPVTIIKGALQAGCQSISVWEYQYALATPDLTKSLTALLAQGEPSMPPLSLSDATVAKNFTQAPGHAWQCTVTGHHYIVGNAMLDRYCQTSATFPLGGLTEAGLPCSNEIPVPGHEGVTVQRYQHGIWCYDPALSFAPPPGAKGPIYAMNLYDGIGIDPAIPQLKAQIATLEQELEQAKTTTNAVQAVQQIKTIVAPF